MFALLLLLSLQMNRSTPELLKNQDRLAAIATADSATRRRRTPSVSLILRHEYHVGKAKFGEATVSVAVNLARRCCMP